MGGEENQFTPLMDGINKLILKRFWILNVSLPIIILFKEFKTVINVMTVDPILCLH
jgi:hypothetical protein